MNITFEKVDIHNANHKKAWLDFSLNTDAKKEWMIRKPEQGYGGPTDPNDFEENFSGISKYAESKHSYLVKLEESYIGIYDIHINHSQCRHQDGIVAWPGILISKEENRGKGLGKKMFLHLFNTAKKLGCTHIEAAPFEFNQRLKDILLKYNFKKIAEQKDLTFQDGKWYSSEHYLLDIRNLD